MVAKFLNDHPQDAYTLRDLGRILYHKSKPPTALRVILSRLFKDGRVLRVSYGLYQSPSALVREGLPDPRLRVHALKIESRNKRGGWSYPSMLRKVTSVWASPSLHRHPNNGSITLQDVEWDGRLMTVTLHKIGLLEVFLNSSSKPLHLLELHTFLNGVVVTATGIPPELWLITQADWNIDIPGNIASDLSLTGISVAAFNSLVIKVYQKAADMARIEVRSFDKIGCDQIVSYIQSILVTLESSRRVAK